MAIFLSLALASLAALTTFFSVRYAQARRRRLLFTIGMASLGASFYWGKSLGGFWPGFYTLLSFYMLLCTALPWLGLLKWVNIGDKRHAG